MTSPATNNAPRLRLYSRDYCHLCHDMLAALQALQGAADLPTFDIDVLDTDSNPEWVSAYDELAPVLTDEYGRELCHYFLDTAKVREYLMAFR